MAPIKFEENLKEKLEQRTINPSAKSWGTLAKRLDAKEEKKGTNKKLWLSVAASFIGVMFMYNMFFVTNKSNTIIEDVVEVENKTEVIESSKNIEKQEILNKEINKEIVVKVIDKERIKTKKETVKQVGKSNDYVASTEALNHTIEEDKIKAGGNIIIQNTINKSTNVYYVSNDIENDIKKEVEKSLNVLDENIVATSQTVTIEITDEELDALLKNAESKIAKTNIKTTNTIPLDYNELLQDVEDDLEESFRDKLLRTVKGGYRSVKTYVAERNE